MAVPIAHCRVFDGGVLAELTSAYEAANEETFHAAARRVVSSVRQCSAPAVDGDSLAVLRTIDLEFDYVLLAWPAAGGLSERSLYTAIVHAGDDLHGRTLPGIGLNSKGRLFQILLAPSALDRLAGVYISDPEPSVVEAQLPAVAAAIAGPLLTAIASQQGTIALRREALSTLDPPAAPAWASVSRVDLPFRRASVHIELRASVAPALSAIHLQATALGTRMAFLETPHVPCAREFASRLTTELTSLADVCTGQPDLCVQLADAQFSARYAEQQPLCRGQDATETRQNLQALQRIDTAFRTYVHGLDQIVLPATLDVSNAPRTRFGFGLVSGYLARPRADSARATITSGLIAPDPLPRHVNMIVVTGAFHSYDASRPRPGWNERTRWFAGTVIAPDIGAGAGLSLLVVRGLAVSAGFAVLAVPTPAAGEAFGRAPVNAADPFRTGTVRGGIAGLSYNFK
jgi:hypothetical protein